MFTDPVQPAVGTSDPAGGLGLRITRVVDDHSRNYHTRPSPDGTRVAFDSDRDGERAVFVANADGRNLRRISGEGFAAAPNWSPDGRTLSYVRAEVDNPNVWNLWAHDLDSGDSRRLTSNASGRPGGGSWFPDGHRIAYSQRQQSHRARRRLRQACDLSVTTAGPEDGRSRSVARRTMGDLPAVGRRSLAARPQRRILAQGVVRSDRQRLHLVARRQPSRLLQSTGERVERLGDGREIASIRGRVPNACSTRRLHASASARAKHPGRVLRRARLPGTHAPTVSDRCSGCAGIHVRVRP